MLSTQALGKFKHITACLITPYCKSQKASLSCWFPQVQKHFLRICGQHEYQIANYSIKLDLFRNFLFPVHNAELKILFFGPFIKRESALIFFKMLLESNFWKINHFFSDICGIIKGLRSFEIKDLRYEFTGSTCNFKDIFGLVKFEHIDKSIEEGLRGRVKGNVNGGHLVPSLFNFFVRWAIKRLLIDCRLWVHNLTNGFLTKKYAKDMIISWRFFEV